MSGLLAWVLVGLGVLVLVVRRPSVAVGLVTAQALVLAGYALDEATAGKDALQRPRLAPARSRSRALPRSRAHANRGAVRRRMSPLMRADGRRRARADIARLDDRAQLTER